MSVRIRTSTRKAYPHLTLKDLDSHMIQTFIQAMGDMDLKKVVLTNDIKDLKKVVEVATRLDLTEENIPTDTLVSTKKSSVLHFFKVNVSVMS